jgi:hypothetical protein
MQFSGLLFIQLAQNDLEKSISFGQDINHTIKKLKIKKIIAKSDNFITVL